MDNNYFYENFNVFNRILERLEDKDSDSEADLIANMNIIKHIEKVMHIFEENKEEYIGKLNEDQKVEICNMCDKIKKKCDELEKKISKIKDEKQHV